ncbi:hypothetical protein UA08_02994 [Talaromyces atroroseus]|uniref:Ketoreductase domain-containing protein n=1 Tax=Talaromyces atroroseus TaxID=1441469 RepID=A0A225AKT4_TALAT|nr:hypothetical protein UA08_02994 [Talaromyces atroroseus]OKL62142.1 hypothetical protein UA08_02994 [Talaromyces atroroseus]
MAHNNQESLVWLVTGCSTGIGRSIVVEALAAGHRVIATGRSASRLTSLEQKGAKVIEIDVNAPAPEIEEFALKALSIYGRIDVLVNNAGYVQLGTIEEAGHEQLLQQFHTNVFAVMNVTRAFLPAMRSQRSGTIFMIGSVAAFQFLPAAGLYDASKAALRGLTHSLNSEVKHLGIRVCHVEPGFFRTNIFSRLADQNSTPPVCRTIGDYDESREPTVKLFTSVNNVQKGNPDKLAKVLVDLAQGTGVADGRMFPDAFAAGTGCVATLEANFKDNLRRIEEWKVISESTDGN